MKKTKVALGLSGGVDSAVSAKLLLEQGYEVTGVYLVGFYDCGEDGAEKIREVKAVAESLGIKLRLVDLGEEKREKLRKYFYQTYQKGATPNICCVCNREIKFGAFYKWAMSEGFDYIATGHYARINLFGDFRRWTADSQNPCTFSTLGFCSPCPPRKSSKYIDPEEKLPCLYTARDEKKDQTYFLALVEWEKWRRVIFPVGDLLKSEVRELARKWQLPVAEKKDSQDICFFQEKGGGRDFLAQKIAPKSGKVVMLLDGDKVVIGEHLGVELYTIGQRRGFKIYQNRPDMPELYVVGKNLATNELIVGEREEAKTAVLRLKSESLPGELVNWAAAGRLRVRIRHQGELYCVSCIHTVSTDEWEVELKERVFAPSEGQFAVFYLQDEIDTQNYFCVTGGELR